MALKYPFVIRTYKFSIMMRMFLLIQVMTIQTMRTPKNRMIHRMTIALKRRMRKIIRMKRMIRNKDHGLLLFITSAACMGRFMCGMGSELIGGMLKPKYHSDSTGRRGVMWNNLRIIEDLPANRWRTRFAR